uniref:Ig-like domain-containing protein n=1 Tax=Xenopus tropicalis TaxID=8364 RepID=A0A6I8SQ76_XENTR
MQFLLAFALTFLLKLESGTARVPCQTSSSMLPIHWYQQKSNRVKRILYYHQEKINYDEGFSKTKFDSEKQNDFGFTLIIQDIKSEDEGTYYCACWDYDTQCVISIRLLYKNSHVP